MRFPKAIFSLPAWIEHHIPGPEQVFPEVEDRVKFAIKLSRLNVEHGTGGPFGAAVFDLQTKKLIAPGVNLVVPLNNSSAHAEVVAITIAQQVSGHYDLGSEWMPPCELSVSTEPCAMCFGAIIWSGIRQLACGARAADATRIGFDEGPKPLEWEQELEARSITVLQDICGEKASAVLHQYCRNGGVIYNSRKGIL